MKRHKPESPVESSSNNQEDSKSEIQPSNFEDYKTRSDLYFFVTSYQVLGRNESISSIVS